jgi:hypothetical protein
VKPQVRLPHPEPVEKEEMAYADAGDLQPQSLGNDESEALRRYSARFEDLHWALAYWKEPYFRAEFDYEDYAPAYCVGYSGCAQYRGSYEDAEKSLCANWERIKGGSRLSWDDARPAVMAAWNRVEAESRAVAQLAPSASVSLQLGQPA